MLAARAIAAIENPAYVCVVSARPYAQRALLKFASHTNATPIFGRFTPGCLTNQIQKQFKVFFRSFQRYFVNWQFYSYFFIEISLKFIFHKIALNYLCSSFLNAMIIHFINRNHVY